MYAKPDKYKQLEEISRKFDEIINTGSNLSYSPLGMNQNGVSLELKKFNRIIDFNNIEKTITVEAGMTLIDFLNFTLKKFMDTATPRISNYNNWWSCFS